MSGKINKTEFEECCMLQSTQSEICSYFDVSLDNLSRWCLRTYGATFAEIHREKADAGIALLLEVIRNGK